MRVDWPSDGTWERWGIGGGDARLDFKGWKITLDTRGHKAVWCSWNFTSSIWLEQRIGLQRDGAGWCREKKLERETVTWSQQASHAVLSSLYLRSRPVRAKGVLSDEMRCLCLERSSWTMTKWTDGRLP